MKLMFASDIHSSRSACEAVLRQYQQEKAERLVLLGDLLYHGPRNNLPDEYDPKGVIALLNGVRNELLCVRGNCDAEVDQMVLQFPIMTVRENFHPARRNGQRAICRKSICLSWTKSSCKRLSCWQKAFLTRHIGRKSGCICASEQRRRGAPRWRQAWRGRRFAACLPVWAGRGRAISALNRILRRRG